MSWQPRSNRLGSVQLLIGWMVLVLCIVMIGAGVGMIYTGLGLS